MSHLTINIVVESRLSGPAVGHLVITTVPNATVDSVIASYCSTQGIKRKTYYSLRNSNDLLLDNKHSLLSSGVADGDVLHLTGGGMDTATLSIGNWCFLAAIALSIGVVGLVAVSIIYSQNGDIKNDYGIVFDAGSSHTAMMVYAWNGAKLNGTGAPDQIYKCIVEGDGISSYAGREKQLGPALDVCLTQGKNSIPGGQVGTTPVYLGATAGMRILAIENATTTNKLMDVVTNTLSTSGLQYDPSMSRIITGEEEGVSGWIQTNYLVKTLLKSKKAESLEIGTLDLGGASTQFACQVPDHFDNETMSVELYGRIRNISVGSFLCFGRKQAQLRHWAILTENMDVTKLSSKDPCLPKGYTNTVSIGELFASPCTWMDPSLRPSVDPSTNVTFVGTSSPDQCASQLQQQMNTTVCRDIHNFSSCFVKHNLAGRNTPFMAIAGFYDIIQLLNLTNVQPTFQELNSTVQDLCSRDWNQTKEIYHQLSDTGIVAPEHYCFQSLYVFQLLTTGYNFNESSWDKLTFADSISGTDLGWAMGYMINATNLIPPESPIENISVAVFSCLVVLFAVFLLLALAFSVHGWKRKHQAPSYQRLSQYGAI